MRLSLFSECRIMFKNEKAWYGNLAALWILFCKFIMFKIFRMRFVKDVDNCLAVRILGMTFSYYKDATPVLMYSNPKFTEIKFREFGESIRPETIS
jgi:hypothetical protein